MAETISRPLPIGSGRLQLGMPASAWPLVSVGSSLLLLFVPGAKLPSEHGTADVVGVEDAGDWCNLSAFTRGFSLKTKQRPPCG